MAWGAMMKSVLKNQRLSTGLSRTRSQSPVLSTLVRQLTRGSSCQPTRGSSGDGTFESAEEGSSWQTAADGMVARKTSRGSIFSFHKRSISSSSFSFMGVGGVEEGGINNPNLNETKKLELPAFPYTPQKYAGPRAADVMEKRKKFLNPALFLYYKKPINIVEGKMQYLFDEDGRRYLDAFAGIVTVSVGHCHPEVVKAIEAQNKLVQHTTTIYLNHQIADYAEALAEKMPGDLKVVYFVNSGSEANDMAIMMSRLYTGNYDIVALRNAYHGMSDLTMGMTGHHTWKQNIPQGFGVHHALNPDPYRGVFGNDGSKYAQDVMNLVEFGTSGQIAGFLAETIQGVGGAVELAQEYLPEVYKIVRSAGGLCIADEVQTGFGRTGSHYWGFQTQGVTPDIVTMAKGIGNGIPLAAVVTTPDIAAVMAKRLHFNTYGGNPVASAAGKAVLEVVDKEKRQTHCKEVGGHLLSRLRELQQKHDLIGDVRGRGLMLGMELVTDRKTKTPAKEQTLILHEKMKDMGVLLGKGGLYGNVFRIKPPMCFTMEDADYLADAMDLAMSEL